MKTLEQVGLVFALVLVPACGQQLVEFGATGLGGSAGAAGRAGTGGAAGAGGGGGALNLGGSGGVALGGSSGLGGSGGVAAEPVDAGDANDAGDSGDAGGEGPPEVESTNPEDHDESVALNKTLFATFSEDMDPLTIDEDTFSVVGPGLDPVGVVDYDPVTHTASFDPIINLAPNTSYTAVILPRATDLGGDPLADPFTWVFRTGTNTAQDVPQQDVPLGAASNFAILASVAITDVPPAFITGDVGLTPESGSLISGFACPDVDGTIYTATDTGPPCRVFDANLLLAAQAAALLAFDDARDVARNPAQVVAQDLNGLTLYPGLYDAPVSLQISAGGEVFLDAQGDEAAVFILRSPSTLTVVTGARVTLTKGARPNNVYWTAATAMTIGQGAVVQGTLIAGTAITFDPGATLIGRALNQGTAAEAITLETNVTITVPGP